MAAVLLVVCGEVHAQLSEKFESRQGETSGVRNVLTASGWSFPEMNISRSLGLPIEGSQSMVSGLLNNPKSNAGFFTPFVWIEAGHSLSFSYKFSGSSSKPSKVWVRLLLEDGDENHREINVEKLAVKTSGLVQHYAFQFNDPSVKGAYRLFVNFQGQGCQSSIAVDNISYNGFVLGAKPNCTLLHGAELQRCRKITSETAAQGAGTELTLKDKIRLFPNPNQGKFILEGTLAEDAQTRFTLFDVLGKQIWTQTQATTDKPEQHQFDFQDQRAGLYFLQIRTGNQTLMQRFQIR